MAERFRKHGQAYFTFITTPEIGSTNNPAEQVLRFVVMPWLPDTNVWISLLKNPGGKLEARVRAQLTSDLRLCSIVLDLKTEDWEA